MAFRRNLRSRPNSESQGLGQCHLCCEQDSNEDLITCNICANQFHPIKCLLLSEWTLNKILDKSNSWSCNKCKSCEICRRKKYLRSRRCGSDKTLILCKGCDKGFHRNCIKQRRNTSSSTVDAADDFYCRSCLKEGKFGKDDQKNDIEVEDDENEEVEDEDEDVEDVEEEEEEDEDEDDDVDEAADEDEQNDDDSSSGETQQPHVRLTRSRAAKARTDQRTASVKTEEDEEDSEDASTHSDSNTNETCAGGENKVSGKRKAPKRSKRRRAKSAKGFLSTLKRRANDEDEDYASKNEDEDEKEPRCPVPGCDSVGHLSGKFESHVTITTCPIFHNLTGENCVEKYQNRLRRKEALDHAGKQNSRKSTTKDYSHLIEQRKKEMTSMLTLSPVKKKENYCKTNTAREPQLRNLSPIFDYEMFREAQARAAELIQEQLKEASNKRSGIKSIEMGKYEMEVWYSSPYPEEYLSLPKLYICEFCLKYFNSPLILKRHSLKCPWHCPPGDEIYRKLNISIFEIDGEKNKFYCQNLCLVAKLFLDHKTLYYDVEPFKFYIMTECDTEGFHIIGYFSKEKNSFLNYNVSCILTFPPYQKQGYGRMLIDFSYLLTKVEGKVGSPEKPLSDLGLISYRSYWKNVILEYLCNYEGSEISIKDLSQETAINAYDIVSTLQALGMLKYWKGKHLVLTRKEILDEYRAKMKKRKNTKTIDPSSLHWQPSTSATQTAK